MEGSPIWVRKWFITHYCFTIGLSSRIANKISSDMEILRDVISPWSKRKTQYYTPCQKKITSILNIWGIFEIFSLSYFQSTFSEHFLLHVGTLRAIDPLFIWTSVLWVSFGRCFSVVFPQKIPVQNTEQLQLGEYPRLSLDVSGLGKEESDVDLTEVNFALILCHKYPAVN